MEGYLSIIHVYHCLSRQQREPLITGVLVSSVRCLNDRAIIVVFL